MLRLKPGQADKAIRRFDDLIEKLRGACPAAVKASSDRIMEDSQRIVPVDTGKLRDSKFVHRPQTKGRDFVSVKLGYDAEYAIYVHENTGANFKQGQAKFLEQPFQDSKPVTSHIIITDLKNAIKRVRRG